MRQTNAIGTGEMDALKIENSDLRARTAATEGKVLGNPFEGLFLSVGVVYRPNRCVRSCSGCDGRRAGILLGDGMRQLVTLEQICLWLSDHSIIIMKVILFVCTLRTYCR